MKKIVFALIIGTLLTACSKDSESVLDASINATELQKIATLSSSVPNEAFDASSEGLYRGIFVSADTKYHGELIIQIDRGEGIFALVELVNEKQLYFKGEFVADNTYTFKSKEASFTIDVSDLDHVEVIASNLDNRPINMRIVKDFSNARAAVSLGTFEDNLDAGFSGTWDFVSTSTSVITGSVFGFPVAIPVNNIDSVIVCFDDGTPAGKMFSDNTMEVFTGSSPGCDTYPLPADPVQPFFTGAITLSTPFGSVPVNEDVAFNQVSTLGSFDASWSMGYSLAAGGSSRVYINEDCGITTNGTWSWRGRSGILLFN